jgi:hypothetical protein
MTDVRVPGWVAAAVLLVSACGSSVPETDAGRDASGPLPDASDASAPILDVGPDTFCAEPPDGCCTGALGSLCCVGLNPCASGLFCTAFMANGTAICDRCEESDPGCCTNGQLRCPTGTSCQAGTCAAGDANVGDAGP